MRRICLLASAALLLSAQAGLPTNPGSGVFTTLSSSGPAALADLNLAGSGLMAGAWTTTTGTVTATSGTITTATAAIRYKKFGRNVFITITVTDTINGTGSGAVNVTLPFTAADAIYVLQGREQTLTGKALAGTITYSQTSVVITNYDNSYPAANGATMVLTGIYEAAS